MFCPVPRLRLMCCTNVPCTQTDADVLYPLPVFIVTMTETNARMMWPSQL